MVRQGIQAWAGTPLVILAWSFPGTFASGADTLGFGIELWSGEWQQASPRRASPRVTRFDMLGDVRVGVGQACNCEAKDCSGFHLVLRESKERGGLTSVGEDGGCTRGTRSQPFALTYGRLSIDLSSYTWEPTPPSRERFEELRCFFREGSDDDHCRLLKCT